MTGGHGDEDTRRGFGPGDGGAPGFEPAEAEPGDDVIEGTLDDAVEDAEVAVEDADVVADELTVARRERDEYLDMVRRVQADFENYKKRMVRQQTELLDRAAEGLVTRLLPVLDAFDLARAHLEAEGSPEGKALLHAAGLLEDTLAKEGLERVDAVDVAFDPTTHEAVEHRPHPEDGEPGSDEHAGPVVTDVLRAGYRYKGRVVRPAMVRVLG